VGRRKLLRWTAHALIGVNALLVLLACISYFHLFSPLLDLLSIAARYMVIANALAVLLLLLLFNRRKAVFPGLVLIASILSFGPYFRMAGPGERIGTEGLRIASFNSGNVLAEADNPAGLRTAMEDINADILCFQELERYGSFDVSRYPYRAFSPEIIGKSTQAIFSEYPIVRSGSIDFPDTSNNAIFADVAVKGDTIRIYNVHLESYRIRSERILYREYGGRFLRRFRVVAGQHVSQARLVKAHQQEAPYPTIICGDFNATPFSHTYRILSAGLEDSFGQAGSGIGATYSLRGLPYRIDYILADPRMEVLHHKIFDIHLSDHRPVMATLRLQGE